MMNQAFVLFFCSSASPPYETFITETLTDAAVRPVTWSGDNQQANQNRIDVSLSAQYGFTMARYGRPLLGQNHTTMGSSSLGWLDAQPGEAVGMWHHFWTDSAGGTALYGRGFGRAVPEMT